ncbi:hypothetical protein JOQ06_009919 [Pogonophryne albipinna]|uniref:Uncharacterized protein n=1 Tax=Pogonophryne albipinna TaxID=1090488 RepID=A0AAD6BPZ6_9TELE|nr:hypothetical protein JOQ06_009919 [Pogonophryne albipinna]
MAECMAARLAAQEEQIRLLSGEISSLRDGLSQGLDAGVGAKVSPELESLRTENEKLRYRLLHLRRALKEELQLGEQKQEKGGKAPEKHTNKEQNNKEKQNINNRAEKNTNKETNNRAEKKVVTVDTKSCDGNNKKEKKPDKGQAKGAVREQKSLPGFVAERLGLYEQLKRESDALLEERAKNSKPISVELPDGGKVEARAWVTTPYQLACNIRSVLN